MAYIIDLDLDRCVACAACVVACMDQNDVYPEKGDAPFRRCFDVERGAGKTARISYMSIGCMHCSDAPCIAACPVGCLRKDEETGFTVYDNTNCIGCHSCNMACPFAAPTFNRDSKMVKCDGCAERLKAGLEPACVRVCPFDALKLEAADEYVKSRQRKSLRRIALGAEQLEAGN